MLFGPHHSIIRHSILSRDGAGSDTALNTMCLGWSGGRWKSIFLSLEGLAVAFFWEVVLTQRG